MNLYLFTLQGRPRRVRTHNAQVTERGTSTMWVEAEHILDAVESVWNQTDDRILLARLATDAERATWERLPEAERMACRRGRES